MAEKRKYYSKQFKIDAVNLVTEQGYKTSEAACRTGYTRANLTVGNSNWIL